MRAGEETATNGDLRRFEELASQCAALKKELANVKSEVTHLREKCSEMYKAILVLCCPKEWYTDEIDEKEIEEALAHAHEQPTILELIDSLKKAGGLSDVRPVYIA